MLKVDKPVVPPGGHFEICLLLSALCNVLYIGTHSGVIASLKDVRSWV